MPEHHDDGHVVIDQVEVGAVEEHAPNDVGHQGGLEHRAVVLDPARSIARARHGSADGSAHHGTPLHFTWTGGDRDQGTRPGFELRTEDDQIRYFYGREIAFEARCPTEVETISLTPEAPGCARFEGDNGVLMGDDCGGIAHLDFAAVDDTGLALQPLGEDDNGVRRFWGPVKEVRFLRAQGEQRRALTAELPELPQ